MSGYLSHMIGSEHVVMSTERTLFWENASALIVADLHIGKTGHFRKSGIGIPQQVYKDDLHRLISQVLFFKAERLIVVGDLSHSVANKELELFRKWREDFPSLTIHLVKGNHDILDEKWYADTGISLCVDHLQVNRFVFVHDILSLPAKPVNQEYIFSGHLHPGVSIRGKGRQSLRFPCFYFTKEYCVLPAFSRFTGTFSVEPGRNEKVFAIMEREIVPL